MSNGVKFFNVGILINMIETEIKIDIDLGYPKPIHNIFGDNLAKKINDIVYNNKLYVIVHDTSTGLYNSITVIDQGDSMEDFILCECNAQRSSRHNF
ncbi:hypothetical protein HDU92_000153 [Lobulomyces angularis]|nr:hypothetical protein HDU92_000153 [Lobulomyces angularis]